MNLKELAEHTPASRDRYVDFLRAASISVVVLGHWLSALVGWDNGVLHVRNAVGLMPGLWCTTWLLQVMPVFFFIGGFSNYTAIDATYRRGGTAGTFLRSRVVRLLKPTAVFIGIWLVVLLGFRLAGVLTPVRIRSTALLFGPLWFLAVYLVVVLLAPVMRSLHRRYGLVALAALALLAGVMDVLRLSLKIQPVGYLNIVFVWLLAHQLGFFYADGSLVRVPRRVHLAIAIGGLAMLLVLTHTGAYPKSMVGTGFEASSNMSPPTVCIIVLTFWLVGALMFLREPVNRWLSRPGPWKAAIAANSVIMTVYLWHITAYAVVYGLLALVGLHRPEPGSLGWWLERPMWLVLPAVVLLPLILLFSRFERPPAARKATA